MEQRKKSKGLKWILDENQFHSDCELRRLRRTTKRKKDKALMSNTKTAVKDWFLICIGTETGLRVQEIADLSCGDLRIHSGRSSLVVQNGKGGKKRIVLFREKFKQDVMEFLAWKQEQGDSIEKDASLFTVKGRRMTKRALQKSYARSLEEAGVTQDEGIGIHSLRHTYATFLLKASKGNIAFVQRQLGHADRRTTEIYTHLLGPDVHRALGKLYA